jgi:hypothetical protein
MTLAYQRFTIVLLVVVVVELEQRTNIKFLVKVDKSASKIREMLVQVYGDNGMKKTAVYKRVTHFSDGRERPATSRTEENTAKVRQIVRENRRLTVRSNSVACEH